MQEEALLLVVCAHRRVLFLARPQAGIHEGYPHYLPVICGNKIVRKATTIPKAASHTNCGAETPRVRTAEFAFERAHRPIFRVLRDPANLPLPMLVAYLAIPPSCPWFVSFCLSCWNLIRVLRLLRLIRSREGWENMALPGNGEKMHARIARVQKTVCLETWFSRFCAARLSMSRDLPSLMTHAVNTNEIF